MQTTKQATMMINRLIHCSAAFGRARQWALDARRAGRMERAREYAAQARDWWADARACKALMLREGGAAL